jgi:hypothetical protein
MSTLTQSDLQQENTAAANNPRHHYIGGHKAQRCECKVRVVAWAWGIGQAAKTVFSELARFANFACRAIPLYGESRKLEWTCQRQPQDLEETPDSRARCHFWKTGVKAFHETPTAHNRVLGPLTLSSTAFNDWDQASQK